MVRLHKHKRVCKLKLLSLFLHIHLFRLECIVFCLNFLFRDQNIHLFNQSNLSHSSPKLQCTSKVMAYGQAGGSTFSFLKTRWPQLSIHTISQRRPKRILEELDAKLTFGGKRGVPSHKKAHGRSVLGCTPPPNVCRVFCCGRTVCGSLQ